MRQGTNLARNIAEMEEDVNAHMMARQYADEFNKALAVFDRKVCSHLPCTTSGHMWRLQPHYKSGLNLLIAILDALPAG